jgi:predicted nuclease of predicted toxin-antitoxin system
MRFLIDMNLSPVWVAFLEHAGFEAVHWSSVGKGNAPDSDIMQWADDHGCVVLTNDLDFSAILASTHRRRPSVVQIRSDILTPAAIGGAVLAAIKRTIIDLADGALVSIDAKRARLRLLPLGD